MKARMLVAIITELVGIAAIGVGIGIEIALHADLGYVLITGGSLVIAGGGMFWAKIVRRS